MMTAPETRPSLLLLRLRDASTLMNVLTRCVPENGEAI